MSLESQDPDAGNITQNPFFPPGGAVKRWVRRKTQIQNVLQAVQEDAQDFRAEKWQSSPCPQLPPKGQVRWEMLDSNLALPSLQSCVVSLVSIPAFPWSLPLLLQRKRNPSRLFLSLWQPPAPRPAAFLFCLYQYILYISGNFGKSWVSANCKRVFVLFCFVLKMFGPRDLWKGPFIYLQNSLHMRTIQKSLKTVIPWTLIKRFVFK